MFENREQDRGDLVGGDRVRAASDRRAAFLDVAKAHIEIGVTLQHEHEEARHWSVEGGERRLSGTNETPVERQRIVDRRAEQAGPRDIQGLDQSALVEEKAVETDQHGDVVWRETAGLAQMRERRLRLIVA